MPESSPPDLTEEEKQLLEADASKELEQLLKADADLERNKLWKNFGFLLATVLFFAALILVAAAFLVPVFIGAILLNFILMSGLLATGMSILSSVFGYFQMTSEDKIQALKQHISTKKHGQEIVQAYNEFNKARKKNFFTAFWERVFISKEEKKKKKKTEKNCGEKYLL